METAERAAERGSTDSISSVTLATMASSASTPSSRQRRLHHQCSNSRCRLDRQRRHAREDWFNQWSHMWTKRQTPEWKPRRASVATCQRQRQQQQQQPYQYKLLTEQYQELANYLSLNTSPNNNNIKYYLSQQDQQGLARLATYCTPIKVNSDDSHRISGHNHDGSACDDDDDGRNQQIHDLSPREKKCDDDTRQQQQQQPAKDLDQREVHEREYESIVASTEAKTTTTTTTATTNVPSQSHKERLPDTSSASGKVISCELANRNLSKCGGCVCSGGSYGCGDDDNCCVSEQQQQHGDVSQVQCYHSANASPVTDKSGRTVSESNGPSLDSSFCSNKPTSTCCSGSLTARAPRTTSTTGTTTVPSTSTTKSSAPHQKTSTFNGSTSSQRKEEFPNVAVSEKLQLQDKQRKFLILSMALKQMIDERDRKPCGGDSTAATGGEDCSLCGCRSRSCSFGLVSPSGRGVTGATATVASPASSSSSTLIGLGQTNRSSSKGGPDQITEQGSKMVLSSSRSMLIDKLNVERAAGLGTQTVARNLLTNHQRIGSELQETISSSAHITSQRKHSDTTGKRFTSTTDTNKLQTCHKTSKSIGQANIPTTRSSSSGHNEDTDQKMNTMRQISISQGAGNNNNTVDVSPHEDCADESNFWATSNQNSPALSCELEADTEGEEEEDSDSKNTSDIWQLFKSSSSSKRAPPHHRKSKRSHSVQSKTSAMSEELNEPDDCCDLNLEALIVESWLDDHPAFMRDYFMRKANHQLIDDWLVSHAKISNTNLSSQLDINTVGTLRMSRPNSQQSLSAPLRGGPIWRVPDSILDNEFQSNESRNAEGHLFAFGRSARSNSQSSGILGAGYRTAGGSVTPVRKISATDFESRTGNGFLRPMLSTTPDGRLTFLSQPSPPIISSEYIRTPMAAKQQREIDQSRRELANFNDKKVAMTTSIDQELSDKTNDWRTVAGQPKVGDESSRGSDVSSDSHDTHDDNPKQVGPVEGNGHGDNKDDDEIPPSDGEVKLIFELVKNICNDLDIRTLLHKILKNIAVLINADKSSLFLVCGQPNDPRRHLVSQLFNVDQDSRETTDESDEFITIPWGTGLVGYVAESGESLNIANCYDDPRFTNAIDQRTGYVTKHMLCAPIFDNKNEIVGVAQVINKRDGNPFTKSDEIKFKRYLQFCGIGLRNAQSYEHCQLENRRNQVLLDLARMIFEEQSTIEQVVYRIMLHTQSLLECERCQVLLIDDGSDDLDQLLKLPNSAGVLPQNDNDNDEHEERKSLVGSTSRPPEWKPQCQYTSSGTESSKPDSRDEARPTEDGTRDCPLGDVDCCNTFDDEMGAQRKQSPASSKLFSLVFDLECDGNDPVMHSNKNGAESQECAPNTSNQNNKAKRFPINIGITSYVAMTGETLNIENAHEHERFDCSVDEGSDFIHKSILCMPIRNGQREIIGVSQLINKKNGRPFNKNDEDLFEAFAIFCGLGIHNTLMYERVLKIMAKQKVTFEVLSYHATAPLEEAKALSLQQIPSCFALNLASLKFNDFSLDDQYMLRSCLRFFVDLDLMRRFQIDQLVFCNWILSVQKNYRKVTYHPIVGGNGLKASPVRYHNWRHAFNVSQMMFAILVNTQICQPLGELETLALVIACLCHDLDHRGTNNSFQIKSASPLAELYSTSTMEHHHFDQCVMILNSQGNQILANLSPAEYSKVIMLLEEAILATDLANYFQKRDLFFQSVNSNQFDWQNNPAHRSMLRCMLMTACDVAAITKPWPVQKVVANLVISEFYQQGDIEKTELNIEPIDMMNRDKMSELPEMQIGFIDSICAPIYTAFAKLFPRELSCLLDGCLENKNIWTELANNNREPEINFVNYLNDGMNVNESQLLLPTDDVCRAETTFSTDEEQSVRKH